MYLRLILPLLAAAALAGCGQEASSPSLAADQDLPVEVRWLRAVDQGDAEAALRLARKMVPQDSQLRPAKDYVQLARSEGVGSGFLAAEFGRWDTEYWRHSRVFQKRARAIIQGEDDPLRALFDHVTKRLKRTDGQPSTRQPWPYEVYDRGFGLCDRQAWVLCRLAEQLGWHGQIVYLVDPQTQQSPHTVCELRRGSDVVYADPFAGHYMADRSFDSVASDHRLLKKLWPDHDDVRRGFAGAMFWTPAFPQDYCPRNQKLQRKLRKALGDECPRFGVDPRERLSHYRDLRLQEVGVNPDRPMRLWFYPWRLLRADMLIQQRRLSQFLTAPQR